MNAASAPMCKRVFPVMTLVIGILASGQVAALCKVGTVYQDTDIAATTPTADFVDNGDGTVTHKLTGLMWKRCGEGQAWSGTTCTGTLATYSWDQAMGATGSVYAGHDDWRLPNVKELATLVEQRCWWPAINHEIFPAVPSDSYFWSSTPGAWTDVAWFLSAATGSISHTDRFRLNEVRLVRGGR